MGAAMKFSSPIKHSLVGAALGLWAGLVAAPLAAQSTSTAEFYKSRGLEILIGAATGGAYDLPGRLIARHIGRHIPGEPSVVVRNMPGANSLTMTNHLFNLAAQDGAVIGMPNINLPLEQLLRPGRDSTKFDVTKFQWIGAPTQEVYVTFVWHTAPAQTVADLRTTEILMGSTGAAGENSALPLVMNALAGTKMKLVKGYGGQSDVFLALERGEVQGNTTGSTNLRTDKAEWVKTAKVRILVRYTLGRSAGLDDVPSALDLVSGEEDRATMRFFLAKYKIARALFAPPNVPTERVQGLRRAFDATMTDPAFVAEAATVGFEISPTRGEDVAGIIEEIYATPTPIVERIKTILAAELK